MDILLGCLLGALLIFLALELCFDLGCRLCGVQIADRSDRRRIIMQLWAVLAVAMAVASIAGMAFCSSFANAISGDPGPLLGVAVFLAAAAFVLLVAVAAPPVILRHNGYEAPWHGCLGPVLIPLALAAGLAALFWFRN
jgi:hypothetical protein